LITDVSFLGELTLKFFFLTFRCVYSKIVSPVTVLYSVASVILNIHILIIICGQKIAQIHSPKGLLGTPH